MKKVILKLDLHDDKSKQKALKTVSALPGIDSISMDMKERKLTVIGTADPVNVVSKLRKFWPNTEIISVGPAVDPKKEEAKKEETKKEEAKEEKTKKTEEGKKEEEGKKKEATDPVLELVKAYKAYNPQMTTHYHVQSIEENPNACVIC